MKQGPSLFWAFELKNWPVQASSKSGLQYMARPLGLDTIPNRLRLAWGVFTGKYDAVQWSKLP